MKIEKGEKTEMSKKKNILKAVIWEGGMFIVAIIFFWIWFGTFKGSLLANFFFTLIKMTGLYFYNKKWEKKN